MQKGTLLVFLVFTYSFLAKALTSSPISITSLGTYNGRAFIKTNKSHTSLKYIEKGKRFKINNQIYRTTSASNVGSLYFPLHVRNELAIGQEVVYLDYLKFPFQQNDVLFSSRFNRQQQQNNTRYQIAKSFNANQLVWHYPREGSVSSLVQDFRLNRGGASCAVELWIYDTNDLTKACQDLYGNTVVKPWATSFGVVDGDIFKPAYRESRFSIAIEAVNQGCTSLQQDGVRQNHADFEYGGCFSNESDQQFKDYLLSLPTPFNWTAIGVSNPSEFKYSAHLKSLGAPGGLAFGQWDHSKSLKDIYRQFLAVKVSDYYKELKQKVHDHVGYPIPMSANRYNSLKYPFLANSFDFIMTERPEKRASASEMAFEGMYLKSKNQKQVTTLVSGNRNLNRKTMAFDYALGNWMIMPDDVYLGATIDRFRDSPEAYADITSFVRDNPQLFNGYELDDVYGAIQIKSASKVVYLADRNQTRIHYQGMGEEFPEVQKNAVVRIAGKNYITAGKSTIGFLYLPGNVTQSIFIGSNIESIQNPNGSGVVFRHYLDHGYPIISKILRKTVNGIERLVLSILHSDQIKRVQPNAKIILSNGREFQVGSASNVGAVYLTLQSAGNIKAGDKVMSFINPRETSYDLRPHLEDAPRITSLNYSQGHPVPVIIRRSGSTPSFIEPNTKITISGESFATGAGSGVRNYYLIENIFEFIGRNDYISKIEKSDGMIESFISTEEKASTMASGYNNLVYTLRKNSEGHKLVHVVNYGNASLKAISFNAIKTFARVPRAFKLYSYGKPVVELPVTRRSSGWHGVSWQMTNLYEVLEPVF